MVEGIWFESYPPSVRRTLTYPDKTLPDIIIENLSEFGERVAVKTPSESLTYAQFVDKFLRMSAALKDLGIGSGDRVAMMIPNSPEFIISFCAVLNIGATVVPVNPLYKGRDISYRLNNSETKILLIDSQLINRYEEVREETNVEKLILVSTFSGREIETPQSNQDCYSFHQLLEKYAPLKDTCKVNTESVALLGYTGGTTGVSKGAMLSHKNLVSNIFQMFEWFVGLEKGKEVIPLILPTSHITGLNCVMNVALATAQTIVIKQKFTATEILETIQNDGLTMLNMVPTLFIELLNHPKLATYNLKSLKICTSGGAPLPVEVQEQFERITGSKLTEAYGLTEASPGVCLAPIGGEKREKSIGIPLPDTYCKIVDLQTGINEVSVGEVGELILRGPQVMKGYWKKPEENDIALRNGWLYTGDVVYADKDGFIYVADRKKDVIVTGGYNVYPREVEEVLYEMSAIKESAVIGIPHEYYGETVKAVIALKEGYETTESEVIKFCQQRLTKYKCPSVVEIRTELPRSPAGKILRRALKNTN